MSQAYIRKSFETRLKTWADAQTPAIPIAWPNVVFAPPTSRYIRADVLPADTQFLSYDDVCREWLGIFQATFYMPLNIGSGSVESLIASLSTALGSTFTQDGIRVYLTRPLCAVPPIADPDRFIIPAHAEYRAFTTA